MGQNKTTFFFFITAIGAVKTPWHSANAPWDMGVKIKMKANTVRTQSRYGPSASDVCVDRYNHVNEPDNKVQIFAIFSGHPLVKRLLHPNLQPKTSKLGALCLLKKCSTTK